MLSASQEQLTTQSKKKLVHEKFRKVCRNTGFSVFLFLSKYTIPNPALTHRPVNNAPKGIPPKINNSDNNIDDEQFGINPTKLERKGPKKLSFNKIVPILSSPK